MLDFSKEAEYRRVVEGFRTLDPFGDLHIIIDDGNVEDHWIDHFTDNPEYSLSQIEKEFLVDLKSLPLSMRFYAFDNNGPSN